jgi:hypothetical protein
MRALIHGALAGLAPAVRIIAACAVWLLLAAAWAAAATGGPPAPAPVPPEGFTADIDLARAGARDVLRRLDISVEGVSGGVAHAWLDEREAAALAAAGLTVRRTPDGASLAESPAPEGPQYHTPEACVADLTEWAGAHADVARVQEIGRSVHGRPILALRVASDPDRHGMKPIVRICGAHHGNEVMSAETVILYARHLLEGRHADPRLRALVSGREMWFVPMVNPDGVAKRSRYNANGKDLNRNYGYNWSGGSKAGGAPYSEPEVRAMHADAFARPYAMSLSFHCSGDIINYLWNYTGVRTPDQDLIHELSVGYQAFNGYQVIEGWDWYETHGDTNDYSYGCRGDLDWTIEVANPSPSGIPGVFQKNRDAITWFIEQAGRGVEGVVTDAVTGQPLEAMVEAIPPGWPAFTHPIAGDYHRVLRPGTYRLRVWAPGHAERIVEAVEVTDGVTATRVDVALDPAPGRYHALNVVTAVIPNVDDYQNRTHAPHALGPADGRSVSLAPGGWVVLDLGAAFPAGSPARITVHEAAGADAASETCELATAESIDGPWTLVAEAAGTATVDSARVARYLRVLDRTPGAPAGRAGEEPVPEQPATTTPGFDLDGLTVEVQPPPARASARAALFERIWADR